MAEIEITLPTVQYGNVKAKFSPEEFGLQPTDQLVDPTALGIAVAVYLNLFTQGFKAGSQMDVSAPQGASQGVTEAQAQRYLDEGLGGVTEVSVEDAMSVIGSDAPGDVQSAAWDVVADDEYDSATEAKEAAQARYEAAYSAPNDGPEPAPWVNPQVDAKPKPWEGGRLRLSAKPVVPEGW